MDKAANILHALLQRQIKKHFPDGIKNASFEKLLIEISETYRWYERDKALSDHAYAISEKEYQAVLKSLQSKNELISQSIQQLKEHILQTFDHALVLNEEAPYSKSEVISNEFEKVILVPYQPTCENLLIDFVSRIQSLFTDNKKLISVRLEETPTSYAEWNLHDNV